MQQRHHRPLPVIQQRQRAELPHAGPQLVIHRAGALLAVEALAVALGARGLGVLVFLVLGHLVHAAEHLERLVVERVDARGVDLDAGVEGARRFLKVGLAVLILAVADNLADVVDEREGPGVLGVDLVLTRQLDAVAVQVEDALGAQRGLLGLRRVDGGHPGQRLLGRPLGGVVGIVERVGERPAFRIKGIECMVSARHGGFPFAGSTPPATHVCGTG